jgi:peroxiredoxin
MTIAVGDRLPEGTLFRRDDEGIQALSVRELFAGRRVLLFALPGAFTPTCSDTHLPGYVMHAGELRANVDAIVCVAVNDAHVMRAWSRANHADAIEMISDGNGDWTRALGLTLDLTGIGLGIRSQRYAALVDDGVVQRLWIEPGRGVTVSGAEAVLAAL